jgi:hypothetical protein
MKAFTLGLKKTFGSQPQKETINERKEKTFREFGPPLLLPFPLTEKKTKNTNPKRQSLTHASLIAHDVLKQKKTFWCFFFSPFFFSPPSVPLGNKSTTV